MSKTVRLILMVLLVMAAVVHLVVTVPLISVREAVLTVCAVWARVGGRITRGADYLRGVRRDR